MKKQKFDTNFKYCGFKLISNVNMLEKRTRVIRRTWTQRLFTFPWKPWKSSAIEVYYVPSSDIAILEEQNTIVAHPSVIDQIYQHLLDSESPGIFDLVRRHTLPPLNF